MTRNLYAGASYHPVLRARLADVPARVAEQVTAVLASDFPARARAIAAEIAETTPDVVGLQEACLFELPGSGSVRTAVDYLEILAAALREHGLAYRVATVQPGAVMEAPSAGGARVSLTDREALLVRAGLSVTATASGRYAATFGVALGGQPVTVHRGWVAVDVQCEAGTVRVVSTHLDPDAPPVQLDQARELTAGPGGLTHGHAPDLRNAEAPFTSRLDLVLLRGPVVARTARLTGHEPRGRTPSGLWPSDHAGVVVQVEVG